MPGPYAFKQIFAADPSNTSNVAKGGSVLLFAVGDASKKPLVLTDLANGMVLPNPVPINSNGFGPAFLHETLPQVAWEGGGFSGTFESFEGLRADAVAAVAASQASAQAAGAALTAAETAAGNAATGAAGALAGAVAEATAAKVAAQQAAGLVGAPAGAAVLAAIQPGGAAHAALTGTIAARSVVVNVKDYGAKGDGATDDTSAINAAWNAMPAKNGNLFFPAGIYLHRKLVFADKTFFTITGSGAELSCTTGDGKYITVLRCSDFEISGIATRGEYATERTATIANRGITIDQCQRFTLTRCHVYNTGTSGIWVTQSTDGRVTANTVNDTWADGIDITSGSKRITVAQNTIYNSGDDCIAVLSSSLESFDSCDNINITGNVCMYSRARGIVVGGGQNITITGNTISDSRYASILLQAGGDAYYSALPVTNVTVSGNTCHRAATYNPVPAQNSYAAIQLISSGASYPMDGVIISSNTVTSPQNRGISVGSASSQSTRNITIASNIIKDGTSIGILVQAAANTIVTGNQLISLAGNAISVLAAAIGALIIKDNLIKNVNTGAPGAAIQITGATLTGGMVAGNVLDSGANTTASIATNGTTGVVVESNYVGSVPFSNVPTDGKSRFSGTVLIAGATETSGTGNGVGVLGIRNATTVPTGNAASGGILYVEGGALKYRGSLGTITTVGVA